jgi:hypothetical protein
MTEFLKQLTFKIKHMNKIQSNETRSQMITEIRESYIDARSSVRKLDKSLHLIQFLDSVTSIMGLMINIFMITNQQNMPYYETYLANAWLGTTTNVIKLMMSCLIHGMVYRANERLFLCLDELDMKAMNGNEYKEALYFKTYSDSKFGFTIAGTIPYNETTLLSVSLTNSLYFSNNFIAFFIIDLLFRIELFCDFSTESKNLN